MYCVSINRDRSQICVVENNSDILIVENMRRYDGLYHVLHGSLASSRGIGPGDLMLANLMPRLMPENNGGIVVEEIIIAVNLNTGGEITANYIERLLKPLGIEVKRMEIEMEINLGIQ